jgi:phospholipase/carboxylesterase
MSGSVRYTPAMRRERFGSLDVVLAGGTDRLGGGDGPLVVLMHGFGASGDDLVGLYRAFDVPREVRFAFPAAPHALPGMYGARAWWEIDMASIERAFASGQPRDLTGDLPPGLTSAHDVVVEMLDALQASLGVTDARTVLGGFSQGSMLACDVTLLAERDLAGLVVLSGTLLAADRWVPAMPARAKVPVFQSHGQADAMLGFGFAERLRDELTSAGCDVTFVPFRGGHEIPMPVIKGLEAFLRRVLPV